jgi:hypothetical protein
MLYTDTMLYISKVNTYPVSILVLKIYCCLRCELAGMDTSCVMKSIMFLNDSMMQMVVRDGAITGYTAGWIQLWNVHLCQKQHTHWYMYMCRIIRKVILQISDKFILLFKINKADAKYTLYWSVYCFLFLFIYFSSLENYALRITLFFIQIFLQN